MAHGCKVTRRYRGGSPIYRRQDSRGSRSRVYLLIYSPPWPSGEQGACWKKARCGLIWGTPSGEDDSTKASRRGPDEEADELCTMLDKTTIEGADRTFGCAERRATETCCRVATPCDRRRRRLCSYSHSLSTSQSTQDSGERWGSVPCIVLALRDVQDTVASGGLGQRRWEQGAHG